MMNKSVILTIHGREVETDPLSLELAGQITFYISLVPVAIGVFVSFFGFSLGIPFDFITTMQMVHFTPCLRIFIPTSLSFMFAHFSPYNFMPLNFGKWQLKETVDSD